MPKVSVIIRALNEGRHLGRLLAGLRAQTIQVDEIVVVDSGSIDDTVATAEAAGCTVVHIPKSEFSFGRSLNMGCEASSGDILLIVSAHVYPVYDTFVEHMIAGVETSAIAYGRQVGDHRTKFSESRVMKQWFPEESIWDQDHPFSNNANAAVRREVWETYKYDETLTGLEDLALAKQVIAAGGKISYIAEAPVVHVHEENWATIQNRYRREAIAYRRIYPDSTLSAFQAIRLALSNIGSDLRHARRERTLGHNLIGILRFRFAQFSGAWEGFRTRGEPSEALLRRFYYPPVKDLTVPEPLPGRPIDYPSESRL